LKGKKAGWARVRKRLEMKNNTELSERLQGQPTKDNKRKGVARMAVFLFYFIFFPK
jgi:hypothetical protein